MKEFTRQTPENRDESKPKFKRATKTYEQAIKYGSKQQIRINEAVECSYHSLIGKIKRLYATLPNPNERICIEIDMKQQALSPQAIRSFLTPHFYFFIECDVELRYRVEYLLHNCPFEKEIMEWLQTTILRSFHTEVVRIDDYPSYFEESLRVQPKSNIHLL
jgi:hypothetical protein